MHRCQRAEGEFARPDVQPHYAPDLGLEPAHIDIALRVDLEAAGAEGEVTTTVVARRAGERRLALDGVDLLDVAVDDPDGRALSAAYDGERISICWAEGPALGERRRVRVRYRVERPLTGMLFSRPDAAYPDRPRCMATDHETERARHWLPCVDHPSVRTPLDIRLRTDARLTALANGVEVGREDHGDGTRTVHWRLSWPCPSYLVCLAVGDFVRFEGGVHDGRVEVAAFAPRPFEAAHLERSFGPTRAMLDWMTRRLGTPFPFPKYYQVALPAIGGAMENISLVTWDDAFVLDETLALELRRRVDRVNVHEMAHSYFGDAIVMRDFSHAWLKESWATYMEAVWVEDHYGPDELACQMHEEARDYLRESDERYARPIVTRAFESSWDLFDQHLYPGGAWRIHMLRRRVGEAPFWAAVQDYVQSYLGKVVETADFRRKLEQHSGLSLERFFDQWLHAPGYPRLKVSLEHDAQKGEARLEVQQTQHKREGKTPLFELELVVAFEVEEGRFERVRLAVDEARHTFVVPLARRPLQVVVDPDLDLLKRLDFDPGLDLLRRSLRSGPVAGRIHAAQTLAKQGRATRVALVEQAYREEPAWGVRQAMLEALADAGSLAAAEALARLLLEERDPRLLAAAADACGHYREPVVAEALRAFLERDLPYLARAAAYRALGAQRGDAPLDLLERGAADRSWWGWVRRGALAGLGATRSERACRLLAGRVAYGEEPLQVRTVAVQALAEAATWQDEPARQRTAELLADLTRDPEYRMRQATALALGALGEASGAGALERLEPRLAGQDRPAVRRIAERLRRQAREGAPARRLQKRVEELEGKLRKLAQRLEVVEGRLKLEG